MSLLNAWLTRDRALIAVDSEGVVQDGSPRSMSKLLTIPHLPAVVAMRGSADFLARVFHCSISRCFGSFDELVDELPSILRYVDVTLPSAARHPSFPDIELLLAGWSDRRSRMLGRLFTQRAGADDFAARDTVGCVAPFDKLTMDTLRTTADNVDEIASAQVRWMRATQGLGGGKLLVCRLNRYSVSVEQTMTFQKEAELCRP